MSLRKENFMADDKIEVEGRVTKNLKGDKFIVTVEENGMEVECTLAGKLRQNKIRILLDDKVTIKISPYDLTKGIITWRSR